MRARPNGTDRTAKKMICISPFKTYVKKRLILLQKLTNASRFRLPPKMSRPFYKTNRFLYLNIRRKSTRVVLYVCVLTSLA